MKCPMCGSEESESGAVLGHRYFKFKGDDTPLMDRLTVFGGLQTYAERCLQCGFVAVFAKPRQSPFGCPSPEEEAEWEKQRTLTSWDSPRLGEIAREWSRMHQQWSEEVPNRAAVMGKSNEFLALRLSVRDIRGLSDSRDVVPLTADRRCPFENAVLNYAIHVLAGAGDRDRLVGLLSTHCLDDVDGEPIEQCLARHCRTLADPILIFGEAFAEAAAPEVRANLAAAVRRGFADLGMEGENDAEFVENAMEWYRKEKDPPFVSDPPGGEA